jgi:hypothetical protein
MICKVKNNICKVQYYHSQEGGREVASAAGYKSSQKFMTVFYSLGGFLGKTRAFLSFFKVSYSLPISLMDLSFFPLQNLQFKTNQCYDIIYFNISFLRSLQT